MHVFDLLDEYVLYAKAANRSPNTITSMRYHVERFTAFLEGQGLSTACADVTARTIRDFITSIQKTYAPKTVANNVRALKTLFAFGFREELIDTDPSARITVPSVAQEDFEIFDPEDIETLLACCDTSTLAGLRDFAIIYTLFDSGMRASELVGITRDDIDWKRGLIKVFGKGAKERVIPVSSRTLRVIRRYLNKRDRLGVTESPALFINKYGDPLTASGLLQLLERLGKKTGLHVHPHKFRHSFAVNALRNDAREFDIQQCLGHTTLMMTRHYARQSGEDLKRQHKRFSPAERLKVRV